MNQRDRRKYPRLEGQFDVDLLNLGDDPNYSPWEIVIAATALDVSMRGLRIKTLYDVPFGANLSVIVYFHGKESICLCDVVWKKSLDGEFMYGLYFQGWTKLDKELEQVLFDLEEKKKAENLLP